MPLPGNEHLNWVAGYTQRTAGRVGDTYVVHYHLKKLIDEEWIDRAVGIQFLQEAGLDDFHFQITFPEDFELPDEMLVDRIANTQGYVIFVHGWTGNALIWEDLPGMLTLTNRQLVAISVDHNGFGDSLLSDDTPELETCNPPACMKTLERWVDMMKFRRQVGEQRVKVISFVGHSMGGATLFYSNPMMWRYGEMTRLSLAPALLLEDETHRLFYTTLGLGIGILQYLPALQVLERFIKPEMLNTLVAGATDYVKELHSAQYGNTPRGVTGATFMAMGRLSNYEIARDFSLMRVMLGHRDPLVGLTAMMDLLGKLEFPAANIHVVPGTHYMFSVGRETPMNAYLHAQNRELVIEDILSLHEQAVKMQRKGKWVG